MVFKMPYFNRRWGISRNYKVEYFWIRKLWRNNLQLAQTHSRASWDLWNFNAQCLPWGQAQLCLGFSVRLEGRLWEQEQILRPGGLGCACALPVLRSCFTLNGGPKATALPSWKWFFNLLAEKAVVLFWLNLEDLGGFLKCCYSKQMLKIVTSWGMGIVFPFSSLLFPYLSPMPGFTLHQLSGTYCSSCTLCTVFHCLQQSFICYTERWNFTQ